MNDFSQPPAAGSAAVDAGQLGSRLRWLITIRLVVVTSVLLPYFLFQLAAPDQNPEFDFFYLLAGSAYAISLLYIWLLHRWERNLVVQAYVQFVGDLLVITGLVYYFGGPASPFSTLYVIVVVVASILLRRRAGLVVGTIAWLLYAFTALGLFFGWFISPVPSPEPLTVARLTYHLAIHLFGFYAVSFMTDRLAQNVTLAERELEAQREDLAALQVAHRDVVQSIPSGLLTTDDRGSITSINLAAQKILGRLEEELIGTRIQECGLLPDAGWDELRRMDPEARKARRDSVYRRGDESMVVGYSLSTLTSADGAVAGYILIFQDLSEWRKLQEEVRLKDRMAAVGELASGIAHEIGNPLAAISGSVQMLANSFDAGSSKEKLLEIIAKESQRLDRTIKGFLQFARPRERATVHFDIAALLREQVELLRNSPEVRNDHMLALDLDPDSVSIVADRDQVSQIFWNLTRNSLRAMPDGGAVEVIGRVDGDRYQICFADTGRGMSEEERANLFHPFQSFFDGGTGIGMAIVYRIVEEHDGRLRVESQPGHGTRVWVELPLVSTLELAVEPQLAGPLEPLR